MARAGLKLCVSIGGALAVALTSGCVGMRVYGDEHGVLRAPLSTERARYAVWGSLLSAGKETKRDVIAAWGPPDRVETVEGRERWIYRNGLRWNGVIVFVLVVPIPVAVPVGYHHMAIEFSGDNVDQLRTVTTRIGNGFLCAIGFPIAPFPVCGAIREKGSEWLWFGSHARPLIEQSAASPEDTAAE